MLALMSLALQAATVPAAAPTPSLPPAPMRYDAWKAMGREERVRYAEVTIQGLRRNPVLARCPALEPTALAEGIDREAKAGELLILAVAVATYRLCPSA